jgi:AcrR family transcriptional regulator
MSPYPSQVTRKMIVAQARAMIEADGADSLSLHKLAAALGVKAPSLYNHVRSKTDVLRAVNEITAAELTESMAASAHSTDGSARDKLLALMRTFRVFVRANPSMYRLAFAASDPALMPDEQMAEALALPLQEQMAALVGIERSLEALRGGWALLHGFALLEISGQFRRGGDLDHAFELACAAYLDGWTR